MRREWGLLLLALLAFSGSMPHPNPEAARLHTRAWNELARALRPCSLAMSSGGSFGVVRVVVQHRGSAPSSPVLDRLFGFAETYRSCIEQQLATANLPPAGSFTALSIELELGSRDAVLPSSALASWQRAIDGKDLSKFAASLPAGMTLTERGCLKVEGPQALRAALHAWVERRAAREILSHAGVFTPLPDDWWSFSSLTSEVEDTQLCLEHVSPAASALRRQLEALDLVGNAADMLVEYTVGPNGKIVGEIGACFSGISRELRHTPAELADRRVSLEVTLRGIHHGRRDTLELITFRLADRKPLEVTSVRAPRPLTRASSTIEAGCDWGEALHCARQDFTPRSLDRARLAYCLAGAAAEAKDVTLRFDVSPAGRVKNLKGERRGWVGPLEEPLAGCVLEVISRAQFRPSAGGDCHVHAGLDRLDAL